VIVVTLFLPLVVTPPVPLPTKARSMLVSSPVAPICGALPVAACVTVTSLTALAVLAIIKPSLPLLPVHKVKAPVPFEETSKPILVSPPVATAEGLLPVAALDKVSSLTAEAT